MYSYIIITCLCAAIFIFAGVIRLLTAHDAALQMSKQIARENGTSTRLVTKPRTKHLVLKFGLGIASIIFGFLLLFAGLLYTFDR